MVTSVTAAGQVFLGPVPLSDLIYFKADELQSDIQSLIIDETSVSEVFEFMVSNGSSIGAQ